MTDKEIVLELTKALIEKPMHGVELNKEKSAENIARNVAKIFNEIAAGIAPTLENLKQSEKRS